MRRHRQWGQVLKRAKWPRSSSGISTIKIGICSFRASSESIRSMSSCSSEYYPSQTRSDLSNLLQRDGVVKRNTSERFGIFARLNRGMTLAATAVGGHVELWDWVPDSGTAGRLALVHGLERRNNDDGTRRVFFRRVADLDREHETNSHRRSLVVGDFNAEPFESAVLSSDGLHAIGIRQVDNQTNRGSRLGDTLLAKRFGGRTLLAHARSGGHSARGVRLIPRRQGHDPYKDRDRSPTGSRRQARSKRWFGPPARALPLEPVAGEANAE